MFQINLMLKAQSVTTPATDPSVFTAKIHHQIV